MIVIVVSNCPPSLRGDLTLWLQEIATGVYVGQVSARVRERLWERVVKNIKNGQATLVYSANNEQGHKFKVHGTNWEVIDHEGLELILKPSPERVAARDSETDRPSSSKATQNLAARRNRRRTRTMPTNYVVVDIETTGLDPKNDAIVELACLKVTDHRVVDRFSSLVRTNVPVPEHVSRITGIDHELLNEEGRSLEIVLPEFLDLLDDHVLVAHNAQFDLAFIYTACSRLGLAHPPGQVIDTLPLARRKLRDVSNYKLETLVSSLGLSIRGLHRALGDCEATMALYLKLIEE